MIEKLIKIAICEDSKIQALEIKKIIEELVEEFDFKNENIRLLIGIYHSGEALKASDEEYDIILQDVDLGKNLMNGYDVAKWANTHYTVEPLIIILTSLKDQDVASNEYGVKSSGFIRKGIDASEEIKKKVLQFITLIVDTRGVIVNITKIGEMYFQIHMIRYIDKVGNETYIHLSDGMSYPTKWTLQQWEKHLPKYRFYSMRRCNLVNFDYVSGFSEKKDQVILKHRTAHEKVKIAKENSKIIHEAWIAYKIDKARRSL